MCTPKEISTVQSGANEPMVGHRNRGSKKIGASISAIVVVGIISFLIFNGTLEFKQEKIQESIQSIPQNVHDSANTARDIVVEKSTKLKETVDEQIKSDPVKTIADIPKKIQESNPVNKKPSIDIQELEKQIHQLTNQYRTQHGLSQLALEDRLSNVARNHSLDMAARNYFSHDSPEGVDPTGRGTSSGYKCEKRVGNLIYSGLAENIAQNNLYDAVWHTNGIPTSYDWNTMEEIAQSTVNGWMNSSGHRENILTSTFDREGIGVAIASDDKVYITQNFC